MIGSSFDVKIFIRRLFTDSGYRDDILEQAQKITNLIADAKSRAVIWTVSKALVLSKIEEGWDYQWEKIESGNLTGAYYFAGNVAFEVIVGILSGGTSVTANAGKEALAILKWAIDPLEFAVKAGLKFASPIGKFLKAGFVLAKNTVGDGISWTIKKGGKVIGELKIVAQKIELAKIALIKSIDDNLSEVLVITTPEGFAINTGDAIENFSNKVLKIMEDAQGNYKVLLQDAAVLNALATQLKEAFNIDLTQGKTIATKIGADKVAKLIAKTDILKNAGDDLSTLLADITKTKSDLNGSTSSISESDMLINNIDSITTGWIEAWKILKSKTNLRTVSSTLKEVSEIAEHANITELLQSVNASTNKGFTYGTVREFLQKFVSMHGEAQTGILSLVDEFGYFKHFITNLSKVDGAGAYIHEMLEAGNKFKGGAFGLRLLKEMPEPLAGKTLKALEGRIDDLTDNRFDMIFEDGDLLFSLFVETKNYKGLAKSTAFVNQFKAYLRGISSFDELAYFFNKRDAIQSVDDVKGVFQSIFKGTKNADGSYNYEIFDDLWNNSNLKNNLWKPENFPNGISKNQAKIIFKDWVTKSNAKLFGFIKVYQ